MTSEEMGVYVCVKANGTFLIRACFSPPLNLIGFGVKPESAPVKRDAFFRSLCSFTV